MKPWGDIKYLLPFTHVLVNWELSLCLRTLALQPRGAWLKTESKEMLTRHQSQATYNI